jgi:hypothetical protein
VTSKSEAVVKMKQAGLCSVASPFIYLYSHWLQRELELFPDQNMPHQSFDLKAILNLFRTTQVVIDKVKIYC